MVLHKPAHASVSTLVQRGETSPSATSALQVRFLFHSTDCQLTAPLAASLEASVAELGASLRYVMLDPPSDSADAQRLVAELGARAPMHLDHDGSWKGALSVDQMQPPLLLVTRGRQIVGVLSPHLGSTIAQLASTAAY